ncbi:TraR/DksA family transcriptional regulator [Microbacterium pygmaeum]|uniref:RNA polymerase-binding transcription factor DksA n=1 Tax=Microbacterium pygmaeum TaxID=370764 RepID=A0A1G8BBG5_9MICO|nr:TraR/DksA C4-type zinc finger protein [Microbacterium pygmaeum]SDH30518.1 RNA polymerase-binding transcription factor DksA [Microbacterium pygmaeum]
MSIDPARGITLRAAELNARLRSLEEQLAAIRNARSDATADDEHDPEGSTLSSEWSGVEGQRADVARELAGLGTALERVAAGTYGICASCGRPIPPARLELLPGATLCVPCASGR